MSNESFPFSDSFLEEVETILFEQEDQDDSLDLFGLHGMITAFVIAPACPEREDWLDFVVDRQHHNPHNLEILESAIDELRDHISQQLESDDGFSLPEESFEDDNALTNWCAGFIEGFLASEKAWFEDQDEATVAGLLLPVMAHSELFDDEDFDDIRRNDKLMAQMVSEIPENVVDLYLLYRSAS